MEETYHVCLMTKSTKNTIGLTIDVSKCAPGLMLQIDFSFFNVESIRGFTSTSEAIYSATSYPLGFPPRSKLPPLDILKNIAITMMNRTKNVYLSEWIKMEHWKYLLNIRVHVITLTS